MNANATTWLSLLPPVLAIGCALLFRRVAAALLAGVLLGTLILEGFSPLAALASALSDYLLGALLDGGHFRILLFALFLGALMSVISASGGSVGLAQGITRWATTRARGQLTAWGAGFLFFFDDYANTLFVGSAMRPITDRLRISREKLAFIVDATSAPVASLAPVSSWIAVELAYISDQCRALGIEADAYGVFLRTIPSRFYPILMLVTGVAVAAMQRDLEPMAAAERRCLSASGEGEQPQAAATAPQPAGSSTPTASWTLAALPILLVVVSVVGGLYYSGRTAVLEERSRLGEVRKAALAEFREAEAAADHSARARAAEHLADTERRLSQLRLDMRSILGHASSSQAMVWASLLGGVLAVFLAVRSRSLALGDALGTYLRGGLSMASVMAVLLLAWSMGALCRDLGTAQYLVQVLGPGFDPGMLAAAVFLVAAVVSFATGTSWGTMGLIFPIAVPLAHQLAPGNETILLGAVSAILAGSVFGDHCSPISDTTIMSAMAAGCDQVAHVRTQLPYALLVGAVSVLVGSLPTGMGWWNHWTALLLGALILVAALRFLGKPVAAPPAR